MSNKTHHFANAKKWNNKTQNGIYFHDELRGAGGAYFTLFREDKHTKEDIQQAKSWLKWNRDVTGFSTRRIK
jgi:thioesterase domain-containing protein